MTNVLEVVRAGAGSGKTTDLCNTVAQAVADGLDPARILATTFTKKAAAELKNRIQSTLLQKIGHAQADRMELASIGTVHSVAHHLLRRYAIDLGLSPDVEVFDQGATVVLDNLLAALVGSPKWGKLAELAVRLGVNDLSKQILVLLAAKRGNRIDEDAFRIQLAKNAARLCQIMAPNGVRNQEVPDNHLNNLAMVAAKRITQANDSQKNTSEALWKLRRLASGQGPYWSMYLDAIKITAGKRSGADQMLDELRQHARDVRSNPRLHRELTEYYELLTEVTLLLEGDYAKYKLERGLVDFTDLEILMLRLLEDETLTERLSKDFHLVVVDEFQDTNPLQLAIFQRLRAVAKMSRWVGDSRQAIYGFRDTDPNLVDQVWSQVPPHLRLALPNNYRSQKGLVQLVGELFHPHFDEDPRQLPCKEAEARGVERWLLNVKNNEDEAIALACGIAQLCREGARFQDIAVLQKTHDQLEQLATAMDEVGLPYLLESPGLFSTREGALLLAGLRIVANRGDSLAAATIVHYMNPSEEPTPNWLSERLNFLAELQVNSETGVQEFVQPWEGDSLLAALETIDASNHSPLQVMQQVIQALEIPRRVHSWGNAGRRCSNLDCALRHASEYEELQATASSSATLSGLILHLEKLAETQVDLRFISQGHDAITLVTYHAAKGLEWPIVILSGLNSAKEPDMWKPAVRGTDSGADPLSNRQLRCWFWPFGKVDGPYEKLKSGSALEIDALAAPEGQEQAIRESEERVRLLYVGCTRAKRKLVFAHRPDNYPWFQSLDRFDSLLDANRGPGEYSIDNIDTTLVIRHLSDDDLERSHFSQSNVQSWIDGKACGSKPIFNNRYYSPSQAKESAAEVAFECTSLPGQQIFPSKASEAEFAAIGNAVHAYMASVPSLKDARSELKELVAGRCLAAFDATSLLNANQLVHAGDRFCDWVTKQFPGAVWHTEVPVSGPRSAGGQWVGAIDLLLELPNGKLVVVDHKSAPIRRDHCAVKVQEYIGQLSAYDEVLAQAGVQISTSIIHFPLAGVVAELAIQTPERTRLKSPTEEDSIRFVGQPIK